MRKRTSRLAMLLMLAICAACVLGGTAKKTRAADGVKDKKMALQLVEQALAHDVKGETKQRDNALFAALQFDPNCQQALWRSGFVRYRNGWVKFDEMPSILEELPRLEQYRRLRDEAADTVEAQLEMARWCQRHGLEDRMRSHLTRVLHHDADHVPARTALGFVSINGEWLHRDTIVGQREFEQQQRAAEAKWLPKLEHIARRLMNGTLRERQSATRQLQAINDPEAISSIEATLSAAGDTGATMALEIISAMPEHEATVSLARHGIFSESGSIRELAASLLKQRRLDEYVPVLLDSMMTPLASSTELYRGRGGQLVYRHTLAREGREAMNVSVFDRAYRRQPTMNGNQADTARRAVADAQQVAAQRQQAIAQENARTRRHNARVTDVLNMTTEQDLNADPVIWWEWWNDESGDLVEGEKQIRSNYQAEEITMVDRRETGLGGLGSELGTGQRRCECLRAGTPVWTDRGLVAIEQIQIGDQVLSQDPVTGELAYKPVLRTTVRPTSLLVKIVTDNVVLETSAGHPLWVQGEGWVKAKDLRAGARLHGLESPATVAITESSVEEETYNLVVADFHTYFIGEARLLSHDHAERELNNSAVPGLAK